MEPVVDVPPRAQKQTSNVVAKSTARIDNADLGILSQQLCCAQDVVEQRVRCVEAMLGDPTFVGFVDQTLSLG